MGKKEPAELNKAEEYIMKGINMAAELKIRPCLSRGYLYLGELYNHIGRNDEASKYIEKARSMFKEMDLQWDLDELDKITSDV